MSHTSKIFEEAPIKVQNKNGFDLSHLNCGTSKTGQLVPVMCKLLPPNSDFTLGISMNVNLPPLATQFLGRVDAIVEGFLIPLSILYGGWKHFISNQQDTMFTQSQANILSAGGFAVPYWNFNGVLSGNTANFLSLYGTNDNVYEYLGVKIPKNLSPSASSTALHVSLLPALAYHLCWNTYYRNKQVTKSIFAVNPNAAIYSDQNAKNVSLVWHSWYGINDTTSDSDPSKRWAGAEFSTAASLTFPDGVSFFSTRQRCYARDYFTAATPDVQQGNASSLAFSVDAQGDGEFTIASLRAANALQKFLETNNLSGDYSDMMRNRWGTRPIDADFDEPYYLGRVVLPVYQKSVYQNQDDSNSAGYSANPFVSGGQLAAKGADGSFVGEGSITEKFHNSTWSYIMCLFSLVPHAAYGYGLNKELLATEIGDFPAPEMQTIGYEDIKSYEVLIGASTNCASDFGYIPRYSFFKYMLDEIHGEMRPGRTLASFALQRALAFSGDTAQLSTAFLTIPQNALDSVFAVSTAAMNLSCWYEIYFKFKVAMPLADFCIPTLGDIQDTHTIKTPIAGSKL